jgi:hypothetical protein
LTDILRWHKIFEEYHGLSYKNRLWDAATVMLGYCSDDGFEDFRGWLIAQGRNVFLKALADPNSLADLDTVRASETGEAGQREVREAVRRGNILSVAASAYESKPGAGDFYDAAGTYPLSDAEKAEIAAEVRYANDIGVRLCHIARTSKLAAAIALQQALPRLYALFYPSVIPEAAVDAAVPGGRESVTGKLRDARKAAAPREPKQKKQKKDAPER